VVKVRPRCDYTWTVISHFYAFVHEEYKLNKHRTYCVCLHISSLKLCDGLCLKHFSVCCILNEIEEEIFSDLMQCDVFSVTGFIFVIN
jgi:hypothetical protein